MQSRRVHDLDGWHCGLIRKTHISAVQMAVSHIHCHFRGIAGLQRIMLACGVMALESTYFPIAAGTIYGKSASP